MKPQRSEQMRWRYEWASLEVMVVVGAAALVAVVYVAARVIDWLAP
jgi:hypothetical protein